ncbi:MAG TPA: hypothetical protein VGK67_24585 [Myxococcales bacterium]|jgi:Leucine-rich repeat (LRR) protein
MVAFTRFDDAVAYAEECTALDFDFRQGVELTAQIGKLKELEFLSLRGCPENPQVPEAVAKLPKLKHLRISADGDRVVLPKIFQRLRLERLEIWDADIRDVLPLKSLKRLHLVVQDPKADVALLAKHLPDLVHLEIWGSHLKQGALPREISKFKRLEVLDLVSCGLSDLPDELARLPKLHTLRLRGLPMTRVPDVVARLKGLRELQLRVPLTTLPDSLATLPHLFDLDLGTALNGASMDAADDQPPRNLQPLPKVLGKLARLQRLNLDCCGVTSLDALEPLRELRSLSLMYAGLESCEPLLAFPDLEELSLQSCHRLHDLMPLTRLARLRALSLENCGVVDLTPVLLMKGLKELNIEQSRARDLSPVFLHPGLEVLQAEDEIRERWKMRGQTPTTGTPKSIRKRLTSDDPKKAEAALLELARYVELHSNKDANALWQVFGVDPGGLDGEGMVALPELDALLSRHRKSLATEALAATVECTLRKVTESPLAAATAIEEIVARRDVAAQERVVRAFQEACQFYDAGHRLLGDTLQDRLIEDLFPKFEPAPLADLLAWCGTDALNHEGGDALDELFEPALAKAKDRKVRARLVEAFRRYHAEASPFVDASYFAKLIRKIGAPELRLLAQATEKAAALAEQIAADLKSPTPRTAEKRLRQVGTKALPEALFDKLRSAFDAAAHRTDVHRDVRLHYLAVLLARARDSRAVTLLVALAKEDFKRLSSALSSLARPAPMRKAVVEALRAATGRDLDRNLRSLLRELTAKLARTTVADEISAQARELLGKVDGDAHFGAAIDALRSLPEPLALEPADGARFATAVANLCGSRRFDRVCAVFAQLPKVELDERSFQRVLAQAIPAAMQSRDLELEARCWSLAPAAEKVDWDVLAYNLACLSAVKQRRPELLYYARRAVELGKTRSQFLEDSDFAAYTRDADFLAAIADG